MNENYCALYLAIVKDISIDAALLKMGLNVRVGRKHRMSKKPRKKAEKEIVYIDDPLKLMELKKSHTYKEIAKMYKTYPEKIWSNISHYKQASLKN